MKILIVEDEHKLSDSIVTYLKSEKYLCEQAFDYNEALEKGVSGFFRLVTSYVRNKVLPACT